MTGEEITTITNYHGEGCGDPPQFDSDDYDYVSYHQNQHGEQSLFLYDSDTEVADVYFGDMGWDNPQSLPKSELRNMSVEDFQGLSEFILTESEAVWVQSCLIAVQSFVWDENKPLDESD